MQLNTEMANNAIQSLIDTIIEENGNTSEYWLNKIKNTKLYSDIMNLDTGFYKEKTGNLHGRLYREVAGTMW